MKKYYVILEKSDIRERFEVTNKTTGKFKTIRKEIVPGDTKKESRLYNKLTMLCLESTEGKPIIKKIGTVKMLRFTIEDCETECFERMFAKFIRSYEKDKLFQEEIYAISFALELAYSSRKCKGKTQKLSFEEMIFIPIDLSDEDQTTP
jgi:hypothetical protein